MIQSNADQFKALKHNPNDGPVVMLNLLKFKPDGDLKPISSICRNQTSTLRESA